MLNTDKLANAIVTQACEDYVNAKRIVMDSEHLQRLTEDQRKARWRLNECTNFFRSEWFKVLAPGLDEEYLMGLLNHIAESKADKPIKKEYNRKLKGE